MTTPTPQVSKCCDGSCCDICFAFKCDETDCPCHQQAAQEKQCSHPKRNGRCTMRREGDEPGSYCICDCIECAAQESRNNKLKRGAKEFDRDFGKVMRDLTPKWEKEFEREFVKHAADPKETFMVLHTADIPRLKAFIASLLSSHRHSLIREIAAMKLEKLGHPGRPFYGTAAARNYAARYNEVIDEVLSRLSNPTQ